MCHFAERQTKTIELFLEIGLTYDGAQFRFRPWKIKRSNLKAL